MNRKEFEKLLQRYQDQQCSADEQKLVEDWLTFGSFPELARSTEQIEADLKSISRRLPIKPKISSIKRWSLIAAVAAVAVLIGFVMTPYFVNDESLSMKEAEIGAGSNKATLRLSSGERITLRDPQSEIKWDALIPSYSDGTEVLEDESILEINKTQVLETPRGGQYKMTLQDGTEVWLNAASSLSFPASFEGLSERRVFLDGEAYFEVKKDEHKRFIVATRGQEVEVHGTKFNIKSYKSSVEERTTLLEGAVSVNIPHSDATYRLKPGQEAIILHDGVRVKDGNTKGAAAWKDGLIVFQNELLVNVLEDISRWYDIQIIYEDDISDIALYGRLSRNKPLLSAIKALELSAKVHLRLKDRNLYVSRPKNTKY